MRAAPNLSTSAAPGFVTTDSAALRGTAAVPGGSLAMAACVTMAPPRRSPPTAASRVTRRTVRRRTCLMPGSRNPERADSTPRGPPVVEHPHLHTRESPGVFSRRPPEMIAAGLRAPTERRSAPSCGSRPFRRLAPTGGRGASHRTAAPFGPPDRPGRGWRERRDLRDRPPTKGPGRGSRPERTLPPIPGPAPAVTSSAGRPTRPQRRCTAAAARRAPGRRGR